MVPTMALIDPYAEERAFIATLPAWRRFLARLNWRSPLNEYVLVNEASARRPSLKNAIKATLLYRKASRPPQRPCLTPRLDDWQC